MRLDRFAGRRRFDFAGRRRFDFVFIRWRFDVVERR
jgi:hypothetical protein